MIPSLQQNWSGEVNSGGCRAWKAQEGCWCFPMPFCCHLTLQQAKLGWLRRVQGLNGAAERACGWDVISSGREWDSWRGFALQQADGHVSILLQVLLHPNSGAAGKDGEIETLRLAQYKVFYTTGTVSLLEIVKSGEKLEFWVPCRYR